MKDCMDCTIAQPRDLHCIVPSNLHDPTCATARPARLARTEPEVFSDAIASAFVAQTTSDARIARPYDQCVCRGHLSERHVLRAMGGGHGRRAVHGHEVRLLLGIGMERRAVGI